MNDTPPRTWPNDRMPTSKEWLAWLLAADPAGQLAIAEKVLLHAEAGRHCLERGHTSDYSRVHARWHRALDNPEGEPLGPIRDHIEAAYAKVRADMMAEAMAAYLSGKRPDATARAVVTP